MNRSEEGYFIEIADEKLYFREKDDFFITYLNERKMFKEYLKELSSDTIVYDVGSFRGFYALTGALGQKAFAFEIDAENFEIIKENISLNPKKDITAVNKAIWNKNTTIKAETGNESINKVEKGDNSIEAITLDSFLKEHAPPDIIKIDVEGAEFQVLRGAEEILRKHNPIVFIEVHTGEIIKEFESSKEDIDNYLKENGYSQDYKHNRNGEIHAKYTKSDLHE